MKIAGRSHGYLDGAALEAKVDEINALALSNVGMIKTSGGLFNFLSGSRKRAPQWMQDVGLEWAWRIAQEPRRLFWRYLTTNPRALHLLWKKHHH